MAYRNIPWYCPFCKRWFKGALGKASHYNGKEHKTNVLKLKAGEWIT